MHTWAKRGLQTALVTGGLLMLGTGIASADEDVNPDSPAGPLDVNVNIPIDIDDNAIGTPFGQVDLPGYHGEISTKPVTEPVKKAAAPVTESAKPATDAAKPVTDAASKATSKVTDAASSAGETAGKASNKASGKSEEASSASTESDSAKSDVKDSTASRLDTKDAAPAAEPTSDPAKGNKVDLDLTAPIQITGNAVGLGGDAVVEDSQSTQSYENNADTTTSGEHSGLAGNVVGLDYALPVQISGNAGGLLGGSGKTSGSASQDVSETGDIVTDGTGSGLAGNVVAGHGATPVQVTGNAVSWALGNAYSDFEADTAAESGGAIATHGKGGSGSGNVGAVPLGLPLKVNGNGISAWGSDADATSVSSADAVAGGTMTGLNDLPSYVQTDGDEAFVAGNIVQPQGAGIGNVAGNAASWIGNATTGNALSDQADRADAASSSSSSDVTSGGFSSTSSVNSAGSGNIADLPVALPAELFGVGGNWIGNTHAAHDSVTDSKAGDGTFANGNGSFLSGNTASGPVAATAEAFGIGGTWIGNASGAGSEDKNVEAGGYNGTLGNDSSGSGNLVQVPLAIPGEVFGVGGSWIGQGAGEASETKTVTAGGGGNTEDDNGFASSNLVAAPASLPAQVFGVGGSWIGQGHGAAQTDTESTAGGDYNATGKLGSAAGNLVQAPVSLPTQLHGIGAAWIGNGGGVSDNLTDSTAGGDNTATGEKGAVAGNVVQAPVGAAASAFGLGAVWGGLADGAGINDVVSTAGGDTETNGDGGAIAGDVVSAQALPIAQVFGDAASLLGVANGAGVNTTDATSGGDIETSGVEGALSGDILDVPAAAVAQIFGDSASVGGVANAIGDNVTTGTVGGTDTTAGSPQSGSGINGQLPIGAVAQIYNVSAGLLASTTAEASNLTDVSVANQEPQINLPIDGSAMPANELPSLPSTPMAQQAAQRGDISQPELPTDLGQLAPQADLPSVNSVDNSPLSSVQRTLAELNGKNMHIM